ncbi:MAG: outer membrane beta-barrel protein [Melioribacteraceae bacterium]
MKKILSIIILTFITFTAVKAQDIAVGPQVGFIKSKDSDKTTIMPGMALRINLLGLKGEGSIYYKSEEFAGGDIKTTSYPVMLTAMLNLLPVVHAEGGIGWYNTKIEYSGALSGIPSNTTTDIGYHIGAGVEVPLGSLVLTGDIRYVFLNLDLNNNTNLSDLSNDYYIIMVGAMFRL